MNFNALAQMAIQITSILGLLGLIISGIIYLAQPTKSSFSPEIINALKNSGIKSSDLIKMPPENAKAYIASHTKISEEILKSGIHERSGQAKIVFYISSLLFLLALAIFILSKIFPSDYVYNGFVFDKINNIAISNAKISIEKRPDIQSAFSDLKGYFKLKIKQSEFIIVVEHPNYDKISLSKTLSDLNGYDSIYLVKEKNTPLLKNSNDETIKLPKKEKLLKKENDLFQNVEVSIQLDNKTDGYAFIKVNGREANILPSSTPHNPRICLISYPDKYQTIYIITREGDTCTLKRIFDKNKEKDFPIRFTPNCHPQKNT